MKLPRSKIELTKELYLQTLKSITDKLVAVSKITYQSLNFSHAEIKLTGAAISLEVKQDSKYQPVISIPTIFLAYGSVYSISKQNDSQLKLSIEHEGFKRVGGLDIITEANISILDILPTSFIT